VAGEGDARFKASAGLRHRRRLASLSEEDVAARVAIDADLYRAIEAGSQLLTLRMVILLARILDTSPSALCEPVEAS
jgi:transcriptional regulator with XRE-family HTH domain